MKTPDITRAQIAALLTAAGGQAVAYGWLTRPREQAIVSIGSFAIAATWKLADALIRHGRSRTAAITQLEQLLLEQLATKETPA